MQSAQHLKTTIQKEISLRFLLHLPENYSSEAEREYPLILFLHGSGERGDDVAMVKHTGLPEIIENKPDFPFIVVSPQLPDTDTWTARMDDLIALLGDVCNQYRVDKTRIYLTGLSLGGGGVWYLAAQIPECIAAIIPICGLSSPELATRLKDIPAWVFHGDSDYVVPTSESVEMVAEIERAGGHARLTILPNTGHDSWTQAYSNPEIYQWLLEHTKKPGL